MGSMGMQVMGGALALFGWMGVMIACGAPMWRVTGFIGNNIVNSQTIWEGIWMSCVVQSTGHMQCTSYDSILGLSNDLQAARAMVMVSIVTGIIGVLMAFTAGKCTNFMEEDETKAKVVVAAGVVLVTSGMLCLIPVSWTASTIIMDFYNPLLINSQRRELGASLYVGWASAILLVLGGGLLCSSCPRKEDREFSSSYYEAPASRIHRGTHKSGTLYKDLYI